jgi:hypothetical protein
VFPSGSVDVDPRDRQGDEEPLNFEVPSKIVYVLAKADMIVIGEIVLSGKARARFGDDLSADTEATLECADATPRGSQGNAGGCRCRLGNHPMVPAVRSF